MTELPPSALPPLPALPPQLPFSAVVGQAEAKLALLLTAVDPRIGGVLLRGEKGSAKTTLARGLAALLPGSAPFVELPVGATEDRVVGTLDLTAAFTGEGLRFSPGLLAAADRGVLYVDEINLLPDHLVDVLLDAAASGVNRVEREGISHAHPSRFLLIGSMNPEEGDLRPQLLDRFGLAVEIRSGVDPAERAVAVRRRMAFDDDPAPVIGAAAADEAALGRRLAQAKKARVPDSLVEAVSSLCVAVGAEGLRADLTICRAAAALAGWEGRVEAGEDDVRRVAPLALAHRSRRDPLEPAGMDQQRLNDAFRQHLGPPEPSDDRSRPEEPDGGAGGKRPPVPPDGEPATGERPPVPPDREQATPERPPVPPDGEPAGGERPPVPPDPQLPVGLSWAADGPRRPALIAPASGRGPVDVEAHRGRLVGDRAPRGPMGGVASVAVGATARHAAARIAASGGLEPGEANPLQAEDLREARRVEATATLVVLAVDASGSMGAPERMEAAKGAVLGLLTEAYRHRDLVGLVAFWGDRAEVLLRPTGSVEVARARLAQLPTGGRTPLAAGIAAALELATAPARAGSHRPRLVLVTDGRATAGPAGRDPVEAAGDAADAVRRAGVDAVVIDVEAAGSTPGRGQLGLARQLAGRMNARHVPLARVDPAGLRRAMEIGPS
jgi:magnesium chelatase subunit D